MAVQVMETPITLVAVEVVLVAPVKTHLVATTVMAELESRQALLVLR